MIGRIFWALLLLIGLTQSLELRADESLCNVADKALQVASKIRGLKIKKRVPCFVRDREEIEKYLLQTIKTKIPDKRLVMEEIIYKALGFIPKEMDYKKGLIDLYASQIGGFYEPDKDYFVMASWMPAIVQTTIAVHEQTHALQDQYFKLDQFMLQDSQSSDILLARSALVEGDATAVMSDQTNSMLGKPGISESDSVESIMMQSVLGSGLVAAGQNAPRSLVSIMIFPYTSGLRFVHALLKKGGYREVSAAFAKPPRSTEEILHPELYYKERADFISFADSDLLEESEKADLKVDFSDSLGEFEISAMLTQHGINPAEAAKVAAGWGGDKVGVIVKGDGKPVSVRWKTAWDNQREADEFKRALEGLKLEGSELSSLEKNQILVKIEI